MFSTAEAISDEYRNDEIVEIQGMRVKLKSPINREEGFVGREGLVRQAMAAWLPFDVSRPLKMRLYGPPGEGKTLLVCELARRLGKEVYLIQGNRDLPTAEVTCQPALDSKNEIFLVASGLFTAMWKGQVALFDEIGVVPSDALAPLLSVLDSRQVLETNTYNISIRAKAGFCFCATLNESQEIAGVLDEQYRQRLNPKVRVSAASVKEQRLILKHKFPESQWAWIDVFTSIFKNHGLSTRDTIQLMQYAHGMCFRDQVSPNSIPKGTIANYLKEAAHAFDLKEEERARQQKPENRRMSYRDFCHFQKGKSTLQ